MKKQAMKCYSTLLEIIGVILVFTLAVIMFSAIVCGAVMGFVCVGLQTMIDRLGDKCERMYREM